MISLERGNCQELGRFVHGTGRKCRLTHMALLSPHSPISCLATVQRTHKADDTVNLTTVSDSGIYLWESAESPIDITGILGASQEDPGDRHLSCSFESFAVTLSQNITKSCSLCKSSPLLSKLIPSHMRRCSWFSMEGP